MARGLYESNGSFRETLNHCLKVAGECLHIDLKPILFPDHIPDDLARRQISQTIVTQPILFSIEYSLAKLLHTYGVNPTGMLGHSVSEYVAACLAGVFSCETALEIVCKRGQLVQSLPEGSMLAVSLSERDITPYLNDRVTLGSTIGEYQCVVSGYPDSIYHLARSLDTAGVETKPVRVTRAFHSMMLDPILDEFRTFVKGKALSPPERPFISCLDGSWIHNPDAQSADYWTRQLRNPVRFYEGITTLLQRVPAMFLEVGKGTMLSGLLTTHPLSSKAVTCLNTIPASFQTDNETEFFNQTLRQLKGVNQSSAVAFRDSLPPSSENRGAESNIQPKPSRHSSQHEEKVAAIVCEVLGLDTIGSDQNILEMGGNSLMIMQVLSRLKLVTGKTIPLKAAFDNLTVNALSKLCKFANGKETSNIPKATKPRATDQAKLLEETKSPPINLQRTSGDRLKSEMSLSLFFFSGDAGAHPEEPYQLVMEAAQFADKNDFDAIWLPERHFNAFGGLYPNPAVVGAAIATQTTRVHIRGGSVVPPLHHPIRIAEEWSVLDNLTQGRIGISFGSGFHPKDFLLAPENFERRKEVMFESIQTIQELWSGGQYSAKSGLSDDTSVSLFPKPYSPKLPTWLTTSRSVDTFIEAGQMGANVLTALLRLTPEELRDNIIAYRDALRTAGYPPEQGVVTLMLHTFVGDDDDTVRSIVESPLKDYLRSHMQHTKAVSLKKSGQDSLALTAEEEAVLLEHAFNRYLEGNSLIGTEESCLETINSLMELGVNEIACLVDFGIEASLIIESLNNLNRVRQQSQLLNP